MAVELAALDRVDGYEQDLDLGGREEEGGRIQGESGGGERWPGWLWRRAGCGVSTCRVDVLTVLVCAAEAEQACEAELTLLSRADERAALSSTRSTARPPGSCRERASASTSTAASGVPAPRPARAVPPSPPPPPLAQPLAPSEPHASSCCASASWRIATGSSLAGSATHSSGRTCSARSSCTPRSSRASRYSCRTTPSSSGTSSGSTVCPRLTWCMILLPHRSGNSVIECHMPWLYHTARSPSWWLCA